MVSATGTWTQLTSSGTGAASSATVTRGLSKTTGGQLDIGQLEHLDCESDVKDHLEEVDPLDQAPSLRANLGCWIDLLLL